MKKIVLSFDATDNNDAGDVVIPRVVVEEMVAHARKAVINIRQSRELRTKFEKHGYTLEGIEENYRCEIDRDKAFLRLTQLVIDYLWAK